MTKTSTSKKAAGKTPKGKGKTKGKNKAAEPAAFVGRTAEAPPLLLFPGAPLTCYGRLADPPKDPCRKCPHLDGCAALLVSRMDAGIATPEALAGPDLPPGFQPPLPGVTRHGEDADAGDADDGGEESQDPDTMKLDTIEVSLRAAALKHEGAAYKSFVDLVYVAAPLLDRARRLLNDSATFNTWATKVTGYDERMRQTIEKAARLFPEATHRELLLSVGGGGETGVGKLHVVLTRPDPVAYVTEKHYVPSRDRWMTVGEMTRVMLNEAHVYEKGVQNGKRHVSDLDAKTATEHATKGVRRSDAEQVVRLLGSVVALTDVWPQVHQRLDIIEATPEQAEQILKVLDKFRPVEDDLRAIVGKAEDAVKQNREAEVTPAFKPVVFGPPAPPPLPPPADGSGGPDDTQG